MNLVGFIIGIYHDARSPERQIHRKNTTLNTNADYWILVSAGESWDENTSFLT